MNPSTTGSTQHLAKTEHVVHFSVLSLMPLYTDFFSPYSIISEGNTFQVSHLSLTEAFGKHSAPFTSFVLVL